MSEVVTELRIDADTSGADQYEQAMDRAGSSTKSFTDNQRESMFAIAGVGAAFLATIAIGNQFLEYVVKGKKELADMAKMAHQVGLSLADLQGIKFGGMIEGLSDSQINAGLQKSADLLNDASRNSNTLSKELAANGLNVRNANGSLITQNQLLGIAADLISKARNPGDQNAIAQMLGFTREWIPLLQQGSGAMAGLTSEAQRAGAVIDTETVERAADFDKQWRKSSVEFSLYMKAAISGLLPYVDDLIDRSVKFAKGISDIAIQAKANVPTPKPTDITDPLDALHAILLTDAKDFNALYDAAKSFYDFVEAKINGPKSAISQITEPSYPSASQMDAAFDKANPADPGSRSKPLAGLSASDYEAMDGFSKVAKSASDSNDRVDAAINTLRRHTEQQEADTKAIGLGAGQLALFRAQAAETSAIQANGGSITLKQAADFKELQERARDVANEFERLKVAYDIKRGRDTAFLSQDDVAIANQLKNLYPDVATAINSVAAVALRPNGTLKPVRKEAPAEKDHDVELDHRSKAA